MSGRRDRDDEEDDEQEEEAETGADGLPLSGRAEARRTIPARSNERRVPRGTDGHGGKPHVRSLDEEVADDLD